MMSAAVTIFARLKQHSDFDSVDRSRVRLLSTGSMPATPEFIAALRADYPNARLRMTYAATEFGPVTALQNEQISEGDLGSVGYPFPGVRIRIVDDAGNDLPRGESGEIEVSSPWQTAGYWGRPEETAATYFPTGIRLGDSGYFRSDGRLVVNGRKKDMLISGGENVFPAEVEAVLSRHPEVIDVAIFGVKDEQWGDRIEAAVVRRPGSALTHEALVAFGRRDLGGYKLPKSTVMVDEIPLTGNNKPDRRKLAELATLPRDGVTICQSAAKAALEPGKYG
jgi:acyl-CoA synthetase (AMP-forming)/AMP-acid ligase II